MFATSRRQFIPRIFGELILAVLIEPIVGRSHMTKIPANIVRWITKDQHNQNLNVKPISYYWLSVSFNNLKVYKEHIYKISVVRTTMAFLLSSEMNVLVVLFASSNTSSSFVLGDFLRNHFVVVT